MKHPIKMQAIDHDNKFYFRNTVNTQPEWSAVRGKSIVTAKGSNCQETTLMCTQYLVVCCYLSFKIRQIVLKMPRP
jgi:hypothetical protein